MQVLDDDGIVIHAILAINNYLVTRFLQFYSYLW